VKKVDEKPHYQVTAGLVWNKGKVLITKRPKGSHLEGFWEFPGGKQEKGESLKACLEREIKEELGVEIRADEALLTVDHEYGSKWISLSVFNCTFLKGEPEPLECQEFRWVAPGDLFDFSFPPPDRKVLEFICHKNRKNEIERGV
jgi:mutator protein MutT